MEIALAGARTIQIQIVGMTAIKAAPKMRARRQIPCRNHAFLALITAYDLT